MMTTGATHAAGQTLTCDVIRTGDTAARLAARFTGNVDDVYQPWFQIVNPAKTRYVPKSRYDEIEAGWYVCVAAEKLRHRATPASYEPAASALPPPPTPQTAPRRMPTAIDLGALWSAAPLVLILSGLVLAWVAAQRFFDERRTSLAVMRGFGARFVSEFDRPLFRRNARHPAVKWRLRAAPSRHRLEILLAPADGRTYPNLVDHRKNVEYDVARVVRLLRDDRFVNDPLDAEGPWVVIPFRFEADWPQEGAP
jgi:hypothetical protein